MMNVTIPVQMSNIFLTVWIPPYGKARKFRSGLLRLLTGSLFLLLHGDHHKHQCTGDQHDTRCTADPGAVVTGLRQVEATGVDHLQGSFCVVTAVVGEHIHGVAVHSSGNGQQMMLQVYLGHILQVAGIVDDLSVAGIVLDETQDVAGIDITQLGGFGGREDHFDGISQQHIAIIGTDFGHGVDVIFQTLDDDLAGIARGFNRDEVGSIGFVSYMVDHIVNTFLGIQLSLHIVAVGFVVDQELDLGEVALTIAEQLGQFDAVGI